ncbi:MAG TPA: PIN domain-containing protein [Terriglobia bacterium]|nr:PIN domain-containing protein [Terriglobia bacterium]
MNAGVLVDTGPLVALLSRRDKQHSTCVAQLRELAPPLLTYWPVVTETAWPLRRQAVAIDALFHGFLSGLLRLLVLDEADLPHIEEFLRRYRNIGVQLVDAALVHLAEREGIETIFTLDRHDFSVYRKRDGRSFHLLPS